MKEVPRLVTYLNGRQYLLDMFHYKKKMNSQYSIKAWSLKMGFSHSSSLEYLLNGKRKIRPNHVVRLIKGMDLDVNGKIYFENLILMENCGDSHEKEIYKEKLKKMSSYQIVNNIDKSMMNQINDWHFFAILSMFKLKDFRPESKWIAKRLGNKVDEKIVDLALEKMLALGLIVRDDENQMKTHMTRGYSCSEDWDSQGIIDYQKQVIDLGQKAVGVDHETIFFSSTMTIDKSKFSKAQELTRNYFNQMAEYMEKDQGDETYQLNIQFFDLTQSF